MLLSISGDTTTIMSICDDTLGGFTSVDSRKFAMEFCKRRLADRESTAARQSGSAGFKDPTIGHLETGNKFVVVNPKKKKKGKK